MNQIVECVANISEGRNPIIIENIADEIRKEKQTFLLHIDSGADANRTVFTFVGSLASVRQSVLNMYAAALRHIDMSKHEGEHPRIGAIDVCPFIPIKGISMKDLITWVDALAQEIAFTFNIPIYLYEESAKLKHRRNLADIRKGEYEGLVEKFNDPSWTADYGAQSDWAQSGASVIGARQFLLAYNINLKTEDPDIAKEIAKQIRGSGYKDSSGKRILGLFKTVKAIGWHIEEYGCAQVSTNLTNYQSHSFHDVYEACNRLAESFGTSVTGSELIGLTPLEALLTAGQFYSTQKQEEIDLVKTATEKLGLSDIKPFIPKERVIEYLLAERLKSIA